MECRMCGAELSDGAVICLLCGTFVHPLIDWDRLRERRLARRKQLQSRQSWIEMESYSEPGQNGAGTPGADGRIPYGTGPVRRPEEGGRSGRTSFANLSLLLGIAGFFTLFIPYLMLPVGIMAVLFGILALRGQEFFRTRAICGIVLGSCLILIGATLIICVSALLPYQEDLIRIWNEYMQQMR